MTQLLNVKAEEINEKEMKEGRICLGMLEVEMDRIYVFGKRQQLHEMISLTPGLGNGSYEVFADIKHVPGHGYRITKLEMEFITEAELEHYIKKDAEPVLEV